MISIVARVTMDCDTQAELDVMIAQVSQMPLPEPLVIDKLTKRISFLVVQKIEAPT